MQELKSSKSWIRVVYSVLERVMYTSYSIGVTLHDLYTSRTWEVCASLILVPLGHLSFFAN